LAGEVKIQLELSFVLTLELLVILVPFIVAFIVLVCVVHACKRFTEGGAKSSQVTAQGIAKMLVDQAWEKRMKDNRSVIVKDFVSRIISSFHTL
jgi:hypothetical protein